jgi:hypothetical protein
MPAAVARARDVGGSAPGGGAQASRAPALAHVGFADDDVGPDLGDAGGQAVGVEQAHGGGVDPGFLDTVPRVEQVEAGRERRGARS